MMRHRNLKYGLVVALLVAAGAVYFLSGRSRAVPNQPGKCTTIRFEQDTLRLEGVLFDTPSCFPGKAGKSRWSSQGRAKGVL